MGAPSKFTDEIANEVCDWLSNGVIEVDGKFTPCTLRAWCRLPGKPAFQTVYRWIEADLPFTDAEGNQRTFKVAMEAARLVGADGIADDMLRIADTPVDGV